MKAVIVAIFLAVGIAAGFAGIHAWGELTLEAERLGRQFVAGPTPSAVSSSYDRDSFGAAWSDDVDVQYGRNGCDTRNDILRRDLTDLQVRPGTDGCVIVAGTLTDPYTLRTVPFMKAQAGQVHIDHVYSLAEAHRDGLAADPQLRLRFANDPVNLLATIGAVNQSKSDRTPAQWQPPAAAARCAYATRYLQVAVKYELQPTLPEQLALNAACDRRGG